MFRALFRLVLVVVVVVGAAMFFTGYWAANRTAPRDGDVVGTAGREEPIDTTKARERGARAGEAVADTANKAAETAATAADRAGDMMSDAGLTAKVKSKIALDDSVRARDIDVDTVDGVVTLTGSVSSDAARQRALQLAKETAGVRSVNDRLTVR